jgi:hypothetical protein
LLAISWRAIGPKHFHRLSLLFSGTCQFIDLVNVSSQLTHCLSLIVINAIRFPCLSVFGNFWLPFFNRWCSDGVFAFRTYNFDFTCINLILVPLMFLNSLSSLSSHSNSEHTHTMSNLFSVLEELNDDNTSKRAKAAAAAAKPAAPKPAAAKTAAKPAAAKPAAAKPAAPAKAVVLPPSKLENNRPPRQQRRDAHTGPSERRQAQQGGAEGAIEPRRPKREFDRHSGTGRGGGPVRGKEVKKDGAGTGNWGTAADEIQIGQAEIAEQKVAQEGAATTEGAEKEGAATTEGADKRERRTATPVEPEEEDKGVLLKDFLKKAKAKPLPITSAPRAANEGEKVDYTVFKRETPDSFVIKRDESKPAPAAAAAVAATPAAAAPAKGKKEAAKSGKKEAAAAPAAAPAKTEKVVSANQLLGIKVGEDKRLSFSDDSQGGSFRGGRGGASGARGGATSAPRGGRGGANNAEPAFDANAFPALSSKA